MAVCMLLGVKKNQWFASWITKIIGNQKIELEKIELKLIPTFKQKNGWVGLLRKTLTLKKFVFGKKGFLSKPLAYTPIKGGRSRYYGWAAGGGDPTPNPTARHPDSKFIV